MPLKLLYSTINGQEMGDDDGALVANGTRIRTVSSLLLPDAK